MADSKNDTNKAETKPVEKKAVDKEPIPVNKDFEQKDNGFGFPAAKKPEKPPFEMGAGLLSTLDKYAAKLLDQGLTGIEESFKGEGRSDKMLTQHEKHHGHHHHESVTHDHVDAGPGNIPNNNGASKART